MSGGQSLGALNEPWTTSPALQGVRSFLPRAHTLLTLLQCRAGRPASQPLRRVPTAAHSHQTLSPPASLPPTGPAVVSSSRVRSADFLLLCIEPPERAALCAFSAYVFCVRIVAPVSCGEKAFGASFGFLVPFAKGTLDEKLCLSEAGQRPRTLVLNLTKRKLSPTPLSLSLLWHF